MKCEVTGCHRDNLSQKELDIHMKYYHSVLSANVEQPQRTVSGMCSDCGSTLFYQEGCVNCPVCGYYKCG